MNVDTDFKITSVDVDAEVISIKRSPKNSPPRRSPRHSPQHSPRSSPQKRSFEEMMRADSDSIIPQVEIESSIDNAAFAAKAEAEEITNDAKQIVDDSVQIIDPPPSKRRRLSDLPTLCALSQSSFLSDVEFQVETERFFGNKAVFAVKSGVFRTLLYPESGPDVKFIEVVDISAKAFAFIRDFMYDLQPKISFTNVVSVLNAAKLYQIPLIELHCQQYLNKIDNVGHLLAVLKQFGHQYSLENELNELLEKHINLLQNYGNDIIQSDIFKSLPWFMAKRFVQSDNLGVKEEDLFMHTMHWLPTNDDELKPMLRFCRMDIDFIFNEVKKCDILSDADLVSIYEMKLGLADSCIFNCNERYEPPKPKSKRKASPKSKKKKKVEVDIDDDDEDDDFVAPTPKKKKKASPKTKKKTTPKKGRTKRGRGRPKGSKK